MNISIYLGICTNCYCSWDEHTIISYDYRRIPSRFDSRPNELRQTNEISHTSRNAEYIINTLHEQSAIEDVYKKLCKYLQIHSILPFNDSSPEYLRYFLHEEQMKHRTGADNDGLIRHLIMLRIKHVNEINLLKKTLENERRSWKRTELIRANDIFPLIATLYGLSVNGEEIRKQVDELQFHAEKIKEQEIYVQLPPKANSTQLVLDVKRHISKS